MMLRRCFHTARVVCYPVEKSALAKLRKATGYTFSKCKEALEKFNDVQEAEKWLRDQAQAHGWEKATKLQGRATAQGLVSVLVDSNHAIMLETNCETDFVSRNKKFHSLVTKLTQGCFRFSKEQNQIDSSTVLSKIPISAAQLANIPLGDSHLLKDEVALGIGDVGENIQSRRAVSISVNIPALLSGYTHPYSNAPNAKGIVQSGRYGALVAFKPTGKTTAKPNQRLEEIGRQICQHIVGMNPTEIGTFKPAERQADPNVKEPTENGEKPGDGEDDVSQIESNESSLLNQEFLLDPDLTVGEFLIENEVEVFDFARFECGEHIEMSQRG